MSKSQVNNSHESDEPFLKVVSTTSLLPVTSHSYPQSCFRREDPNDRRERIEKEMLQIAIKNSLKENGLSKQHDFFQSNVGFSTPIHLPANLSKQTISFTFENSEWKKEEITALIALYQSEECLYDQTHPSFLDEQEKDKAYLRIQTLLTKIKPSCSVVQIKDQIRSLLTQYISEKIVKDSAIMAGQVTEHSYEPLMWCFGLLQFLDDYIVKTVIPNVKEEIEVVEDSRSQNPIDFYNMNIVGERKDNYLKEHKKRDYASVNEISPCADDKEGSLNLKNSSKRKIPRKSVNCVPAFVSDERDDIFGEYIASEMRILKHNASLYLKTKQAIIDILTSASFEFLNPN